MDLHETAVLDLPPQKVWQALNDPSILKMCVPGCQEITVVDPTTFSAKAVIKVGFITSKFDKVLVKKTQSIENELLSFEMSGEDNNRIGSFKQTLTIKMTGEGTSESPKTSLALDAQVDLKGKFATLGKRIVEWKAKSVMEEFVQNLRKLA